MQEKSYFNPYIAQYYLAKAHNRPHAERKMRLVFLVQNDFIWDKQSTVYDVLAADD